MGWQQWMVDEIINNALTTLSPSPPPPITTTTTTTTSARQGTSARQKSAQEQGANEEEKALIYTARQAIRRMRAQSTAQSNIELNDIRLKMAKYVYDEYNWGSIAKKWIELFTN